jgi:hypothetical protein
MTKLFCSVAFAVFANNAKWIVLAGSPSHHNVHLITFIAIRTTIVITMSPIFRKRQFRRRKGLGRGTPVKFPCSAFRALLFSDTS